jgi:hypothetical protein
VLLLPHWPAIGSGWGWLVPHGHAFSLQNLENPRTRSVTVRVRVTVPPKRRLNPAQPWSSYIYAVVPRGVLATLANFPSPS